MGGARQGRREPSYACHMGATEDAASRRPARPGGTRLIVKRVLKRIRSFWKPRPADDHPLTGQERDQERERFADDERARIAEGFVGNDLDPDEPRAGKLD